jgi:hypothetical protein
MTARVGPGVIRSNVDMIQCSRATVDVVVALTGNAAYAYVS